MGLRSHYHTSLMFGCQWWVDGVNVEAMFFLVDDDTLCVRLTGSKNVAVAAHIAGQPPVAHTFAAEPTLDVSRGQPRYAVLLRGQDADAHGAKALERAESAFQEALAADARFAAACPSLSGDWPAHWREGLHHDFQTTRLLVQPAGGIFKDVWPAWMASWPRVVLAEGTLDMLRLAYADPRLATRAVLSVFRDAPEPNVPCVFRGGEYNMAAADGSRCGTSPAWCLPFVNLELLYLRTLDRDWLAELYPLAAAYIQWWLDNRTDADGWIVYKCTWESGEDGNPRLDPTGSGDADISARVRPVELQATLSHAAGVLAFFASELGLDRQGWTRVQDDYRDRTRQLFDSREERYRDWLITEQRFQDACLDRPYWGIDPCRYSAQSLTPLLIDLDLSSDEVWRHAVPPWTLWPSWTWSLVESAAAARLYSGVGRLAFETIERVYRATTRRDVNSFARPLPGASPEFWPEDWRTYTGSDAYGWGATTANLLIRHLFGFKESRETDGWVVELCPSFPDEMLEPGARYGVRNMNYRGLTFDLTYTVKSDGRLDGHLVAGGLVRDVAVRVGERYMLRLR
jgi:hypothetical protein